MAVLEWTGTANAVTSDVVSDWTSASYTAGGFFINTTTTVSGVVAQTPAAATLTTGTSLTVTLGSTFNNLIVFVWTEGTAAQNFTLDLGKCQLEPGAVATQFEYKQTNTDEFQLCQRYCEVLSGYWAYRASYVTANTFECPLPPFKVVKLVAPVITLKSGVVNTNLSANPVNASGAYTGFTSVTFSRQTVNGAAIILTKSGHGYTDGVIEADQTVSILVEANL
jgi:hypothetical protein